MTGPEDEIAAAWADRGLLRASHADREQVIDTLKAAFVQGRLAKDEFDARVGQAFASRTYAELAAVTGDIPAGPTGARSPENTRIKASVRAVTAGGWASQRPASSAPAERPPPIDGGQQHAAEAAPPRRPLPPLSAGVWAWS